MAEPFTPSYTDALWIMAQTDMKPFKRSDYDAWAGVVSHRPLIGVYELDKTTIILDDNCIVLVRASDGAYVSFELKGYVSLELSGDDNPIV